VRRSFGVIFQDFVRYDFRFDENIGVGEIDHVRVYLDHSKNGGHNNGAGNGSAALAASQGESNGGDGNGAVPTSIVTAAEKSLAASLLGRFPQGYKQMLGRRFETGVELSGGEWQKVALARAYMRNAQALILDEPTAALDARAEYEVFKKFAELAAGRMTIIISHRFSTVRIADRIIVLQAGRIIQSGTHAELLVRGGLYSELFSLQAEGYR
jgi:ATP-binding cassette subfamily B protein